LIAAHVNWQFVFPKSCEGPTPAERRAIDRASWFANDQSGYFREHATRPQTIGYPLADSAAVRRCGSTRSFRLDDNHGNPEDALAVDAMLDDISLYWFTTPPRTNAGTTRVLVPWRAPPALRTMLSSPILTSTCRPAV